MSVATTDQGALQRCAATLYNLSKFEQNIQGMVDEGGINALVTLGRNDDDAITMIPTLKRSKKSFKEIHKSSICNKCCCHFVGVITVVIIQSCANTRILVPHLHTTHFARTATTGGTSYTTVVLRTCVTANTTFSNHLHAHAFCIF